MTLTELHIKLENVCCSGSEPIWPSGKVLGWYSGKQKDFISITLWLSFLFKSCGLWMMPCDCALIINQTQKQLILLPILMQLHSGGKEVNMVLNVHRNHTDY